jgi:predicted phage terminase large subunit-like protein
VWARNGADFYLLDQVRDKMDFDETVAAMKAVKKKWPESSSIVIEAQQLGAALASHLKKQIPGIIPIHVQGDKQLRAMNCVPLWQSRNVYIPHTSVYPWVHDYVGELLNFPNAPNDDQVDATTLALNQLRGSLFPNMKAVAKPIEEKAVKSRHEYVVGWIPARSDDEYTVVVYDQDDNEVVRFFRAPARPVQQQVRTIYDTFVYFNGAVVRVIKGFDEALTHCAELKGTYIQKVKFTKAKLTPAYENLSQLIESRLITIPEYPELMAELSVFTSAFTYDEKPDYSLQVAQQSGIHALCLVTHDLDPTMWEYHPDIYYGFDPDRLDPSLWFPDDNS